MYISLFLHTYNYTYMHTAVVKVYKINSSYKIMKFLIYSRVHCIFVAIVNAVFKATCSNHNSL